MWSCSFLQLYIYIWHACMAWRHEWPGNTYIACVHDMHEWHESHTVFTRIMNVLFFPKIDAKLGGGFSLCRVTFWVTFFLRFGIWCSGTAAVSEASLSCHSTTWSAINWKFFVDLAARQPHRCLAAANDTAARCHIPRRSLQKGGGLSPRLSTPV